jgi:hypothetical protein
MNASSNDAGSIFHGWSFAAQETASEGRGHAFIANLSADEADQRVRAKAQHRSQRQHPARIRGRSGRSTDWFPPNTDDRNDGPLTSAAGPSR